MARIESSGPDRRNNSERLPPRTYRIAMYSNPSASPAS